MLRNCEAEHIENGVLEPLPSRKVNEKIPCVRIFELESNRKNIVFLKRFQR